MSTGPSDLLARFQEGDASAFNELVKEMGPRLKGYFFRQGAQSTTAEDLAQHVFLKAFQSRSRYQSSGRLDAYLLRIARNLWIDYCRRRRPLTLGESFPDAVDTAPSPWEDGHAQDRAQLLHAALGQLDDSTRELVELAIFQQLPYREVGEIMKIPVGTVKSRVHYILQKLKRQLEPILGSDSENDA